MTDSSRGAGSLIAPPKVAARSSQSRALLVLGLGMLMAGTSSTVTNIALHTVGQSLHSSVGDVQWIVTGYLLATASVIPLSGWVAKRFGSRSVYITALVLFTLSSMLCALAASLPELVACRIVQGAAAGLLLPLSQFIAAEVAGPGEMARAMSRIWMICDLGLVFAPVIGGALVSGPGWRWIFLINLPLGTVAIVAAALLLPHTPSREAGKLDLTGALRLSPGVLLLVLALAQAEGNTTPISPRVLVPLIAGALLLADFARHAWRHQHPLLDLRLFTRRRFAFGALSLFCIDVAWFGMFLLVPLYLQQVRHLSPPAVGLLLAPEGIGSVLGLWAAGRIHDTVQARYAGLAGVVAFILTTIVFTTIGPAGSYWIIVPALLVSGVAAGLAWVPATAAGYLDLAPEKISDASSLVSVTMRLGASFGTALAAVTLQRGLEHSTSASPLNHVIGAYRGSFAWILVPAALALVMFAGLCRSK